jgi:hypothetical protein
MEWHCRPALHAPLLHVSASPLTQQAPLQLKVAMVPSGDACNCWVIDSAQPSYVDAWRGQQDAASLALPATTAMVRTLPSQSCQFRLLRGITAPRYSQVSTYSG